MDDALEAQLYELEPFAVANRVVAHLAKRLVTRGSPLTLLQEAYQKHLKSAFSPSALRPSTATSADHHRREPIHVFTDSAENVRVTHAEMVRLHTQYRQLASESIVKDHEILRLREALQDAETQVQTLQRAVTSKLVAQAAEVSDTEMLAEYHRLNEQLADQVRAFEDNMDIGGHADVNELNEAIHQLELEKEELAAMNMHFAQLLLDADGKLTSSVADSEAKDVKLVEFRRTIEQLQQENQALRAELVQLRVRWDEEHEGGLQGTP